MIRIVLDTNVLVLAILNPFGAPAQVLAAILSGQVELLYDARIVSEYRSLLARPKFQLNQALVNHTLAAVTTLGQAVVAAPLQPLTPDATDTPFYEVAIHADALLVTGNTRHFPSDDPRVIMPTDLVSMLTTSN